MKLESLVHNRGVAGQQYCVRGGRILSLGSSFTAELFGRVVVLFVSGLIRLHLPFNMAQPAPRKNGLQPPYTLSVVLAWLGQAISFAFSGVVVYLLNQDWAIAVTVVLSVLFISLWFYVQSVDPSQPGGLLLPCIRDSQATTRYCSICKKVVPGLDHHCPWLGHCIGTRNYFQFYILTLVGWLCAGWQCIIGVLTIVMVDWRENSIHRAGDSVVTFSVLMSLHLACSATVFCWYLGLWGFHTYLLFIGKGTYMFLIDRREKMLEARSKALEARTEPADVLPYSS